VVGKSGRCRLKENKTKASCAQQDAAQYLLDGFGHFKPFFHHTKWIELEFVESFHVHTDFTFGLDRGLVWVGI
jgi:hypothetical protein